MQKLLNMSSDFSKIMEQLKSKGKITVVKSMRDYSKDEFFVKKAAMAKETLDRTLHTFPTELLTSLKK